MSDRSEVLQKAEGSRLQILENAWVRSLQALNAETDPARIKALARAEADARRNLEAARAGTTPSSATPAEGRLHQTYHNRAEATEGAPKAVWRDFFRNRREAFDEFILGEIPGAPSRAKFYDDCKEVEGLLQADKTVWLSDLLRYVKETLKVSPVTRRFLEDREKTEERSRELDDLAYRQEQAKTKKMEWEAEEQQREASREWIRNADHETQMAAFALRLEESLRQASTLRLSALVHACGGSPARGPELSAELARLHAEALTDAVRLAVQTIIFEEEEDAA